jgi:peptidyl-prolyl cis-trans isomerase D
MQASGNALGRDAVYQGLLQQAYLQQGGHDLGVNASLAQIKHVIAVGSGLSGKRPL